MARTNENTVNQPFPGDFFTQLAAIGEVSGATQGIGQRLSLAVIQLDLFGGQRPVDTVKNRTDLDSSIRNLHSLVSDVHNLSHRLHFAHLEHVGLKTAIAELCRQISHSYGLEIDLQTDAAPPHLAQDVSLCFYRVAQEALNNVVKHSKSNTAS